MSSFCRMYQGHCISRAPPPKYNVYYYNSIVMWANIVKLIKQSILELQYHGGCVYVEYEKE